VGSVEEQRGCMGKEIRWLTGANTTRILPMGSMRRQNPETMARLGSSVPGSADVRKPEGVRRVG